MEPLSLVMKKSSVSRTRRFTYSHILCNAMERWARTHNQILFGKINWCGSTVHHNTELWTPLMVSRWNSSGMFSQASPHCSSATKSKSSSQKKSKQPEEFNGRIIFMSMFNDISWGSEENKREWNANADLVSTNARSFSPGRGHSSDLDQKRSGILLMKANHKENATVSHNWWWSNSVKADTQFSVLRVHCPEVRSKAKVVGNYQHTCALMRERLKLFFAFFSIQLSIYGAVSDLCDEYRICHVRAERLLLAGQSDPLFVPTSPTPSTDDLAQEDLFQKYQERVERLSQQNRAIKFCTDAGFLTTVDVGQHFMTKDTE